MEMSRTGQPPFHRPLAREGGFTMIELLIVMLILAVVLAALTTTFVAASNAQLDLTSRFQAQQQGRIALDSLRQDVHCAISATVVGDTSLSPVFVAPGTAPVPSLTLNLGAAGVCQSGSGNVTWCTRPGTVTARWTLYRIAGAVCTTTGGALVADFLTTPYLFTPTAQSATSLAVVHVSLPVQVQPNQPTTIYRLDDDLVLRNSSRS
jgi:prepilin-type N-terminal cleavage/methylation domain-containing protein